MWGEAGPCTTASGQRARIAPITRRSTATTPWLAWTVPGGTVSGIYALEVECAGGLDHIPFVVRPGRATKSKIALLAPTFSYLAYANEQHWWSAPNIR